MLNEDFKKYKVLNGPHAEDILRALLLNNKSLEFEIRFDDLENNNFTYMSLSTNDNEAPMFLFNANKPNIFTFEAKVAGFSTLESNGFSFDLSQMPDVYCERKIYPLVLKLRMIGYTFNLIYDYHIRQGYVHSSELNSFTNISDTLRLISLDYNKKKEF